MIRTFIALAAFAVVFNAPAAGPVDLDVPDNLAAVQRDRPEHYAKIQKILAEAPVRAWNAQTLAQWMQVDFDAREVRATDLIMTSYPPKKRLDFSLDATSYTKIVTLEANATAMPVDSRQAYIKAARAGDCKAALRLAEMYENGESGVARDRAEAAKWFNAARVLGCEVPVRYSNGRRGDR